MKGCASALIVRSVKLSSTSPPAPYQRAHKPANPIGEPSRFTIRAETALPDRQSGSKIASAGTTQRCPFRHASRKLGLSATVSERAL